MLWPLERVSALLGKGRGARRGRGAPWRGRGSRRCRRPPRPSRGRDSLVTRLGSRRSSSAVGGRVRPGPPVQAALPVKGAPFRVTTLNRHISYEGRPAAPSAAGLRPLAPPPPALRRPPGGRERPDGQRTNETSGRYLPGRGGT